MDKLLTTKTVAQILAVSRMTVYRLMDRGKLPAVMLSDRTRIRASDLEKYIRGLETKIHKPKGNDLDQGIKEMEHYQETGAFHHFGKDS